MLLVAGIAAVTAAVLVLGTVVTGSGPHSGDPKAGRTGFDPELVSQLHADVVFLLVGLTVALLRRALRDRLPRPRPPGGPRPADRRSSRRASSATCSTSPTCRSRWCCVHMLGAVLITAFTARLVWSVRGPASELPLDSPPDAAATR